MSKTKTTSKNVYQRIQTVRRKLVDLNLKKSGKNTYSKFTYYELGDFLPSLNRLMDEHGLMTKFNLVGEKANLQVFNSSDPKDFITFYTPTAEVEIGKPKEGKGGAQPIQNLGGKITYLRRYLLMMAFEIIEDDAVDIRKQEVKAKTVHKELDEASIKKINDSKDQLELAEICKKIRGKKGPPFQKSLVEHYSARKEELREEGK